MKRNIVWTAFAVVLLAASAVAQSPEQYLDLYVAQVKPEKRADFDAVTKKMALANRDNKGDEWLAMETAYGPIDRVTFISIRQSYADAEKGGEIFLAALEKAYGKAGAGKLEQDFQQCILSARTEIRRRRWDLSSNAPTDSAGMAKLLGSTRYLRTNAVHVRPGQIAAFESLLKEAKEARDKLSPPQVALVSQSVAGQEGTVFYITYPKESLAAFDNVPLVQQILGDEGYRKYLKVNEETVSNNELVINRFVPELSNAPADVVATAPDFWQPKTAVAKTSKPKSPVQNAISKEEAKK